MPTELNDQKADDMRAADRLRVLLVPCDADCPVTVVDVADSSVALSDLLGGCVLEDQVHRSAGGPLVRLYVPAADSGPVNRRVGELLGHPPERPTATARGDVVITGVGVAGNDVDVPAALVWTASTLRMLPGSVPTPAVDAPPVPCPRSESRP